MLEIEEIEEIVEACLTLDSVIQEHGTDVMTIIVRMLLFEVGKEIARHEINSRALPGAD